MIGVVAGSFDPITDGHEWLIQEGLRLVNELYVVVGVNPAKKYMFTEPERIEMVQAVVTAVQNPMCNPDLAKKKVHIVTIDNQLLVHFAQTVEAHYLIRGIRNSADFEYEAQIQLINKKIAPDIETVYFIPPRELTEVSSSTVKGLVGCQGWELVVDDYVNPFVLEQLKQKVKK